MGIFDSLFGKKVTIELRDDKGNIVKRKVDEDYFDDLVAQGEIKKIDTADSIQAHILDPIRGYYVESWVVGEDIERKTAEAYATDGLQLYVIIFYEDGKPNVHVIKKELWEDHRSNCY